MPQDLSLVPQKRWITTEIEINASSAVVWKVLTDFPGYGSWNPIIRQIEGELIVGKRLRVFARLPCGLPMVLWPKVLSFGIEQEIRWLGSLLVSGLLDGEHLFMLEPLGEAQVRFVQREVYSGVLLPIIWPWLRSQSLEAFGMMNRAIKAAAERSEDAGTKPLSSCPESPNCVSTEATNNRHKIDVFRLKGDFSKNWLEIQHVVAALPRNAVIRADKTYFHATFKSRVFQFVDDLELFMNPLNGIISIRSAARTGYWDFGVNRRRVEQLRHALQSRDLIIHP